MLRSTNQQQEKFKHGIHTFIQKNKNVHMHMQGHLSLCM
jgi:sRNA-binding regulator protein Hfq